MDPPRRDENAERHRSRHGEGKKANREDGSGPNPRRKLGKPAQQTRRERQQGQIKSREPEAKDDAENR